MFSNKTSIPSHNSPSTDWTANRPWTTFEFETATVIAVLSPVAVAGNALILAAIWKKTFARTPFHILLSGLAFTDLCTGLIAQPFYAGSTLMKVANHREEYFIFSTIGDSSAIYFILITVLFIALMSIERWLHMSRRSLVTSRRGCFTVIVLLLIPIPSVVYRVLAKEDNENEVYARIVFRMIIPLMISSYLATSFAYFKVYRIIRHHQHHIRANETSPNFGRQAIDLAKYKKSVASILYILVLFSICFVPFIACSGVFVSVPVTFETLVAVRVSVVLLFLSSSLNPGLYVWRMNDIRYGVKQLFCRPGIDN